MDIRKKILTISFYRLHLKEYKEMIAYDARFNASFRGVERLGLRLQRSYEWRCIKRYRLYQANVDTIWGVWFRWRLNRLAKKTGMDFEGNPHIGKGLIIGHWGKIVLNKEASWGDQIFLTHGVTVGRDVRGTRAGVPTIGNRVCIRTNSTIVGKITIGDDVLIAPNTFVNFDVPSHSIVIGNPATIHHRDYATYGHLPEME